MLHIYLNLINNSTIIGTELIVDLANGTYSCTLCGHVAAHKGNLKKHVETHSDFNINCVHCGKPFKTKNSYYSHLYRIHKTSAKMY